MIYCKKDADQVDWDPQQVKDIMSIMVQINNMVNANVLI